MSTAGLLGGADGDPRVPTINIKKHQWRAPWEALLEIWERPPSMLINIDGWPPDPYVCVGGGESGLHPEFERCVVTCIGMIDKK
jgi:hypothetical protein